MAHAVYHINLGVMLYQVSGIIISSVRYQVSGIIISSIEIESCSFIIESASNIWRQDSCVESRSVLEIDIIVISQC